MRRRRAVLVGLAAVLVAAAASGGAGALTASVPQLGVDADAVSLRVSLAADGTGHWRVAYRLELDDANATDAFEGLRSDLETDPGPYLDRFGDRMRRAMWTAENATGREMAVGNLSVDARLESLPQGEYGIVVYRLDWAGFAAVEGDRLEAGDAIDQFFLDSRTALTIAWPGEYGLASVDPEPTATDEGAVTWQGRRDFGPGEPRVAVVRGASNGTAPPPAGESGSPLVPVAALVVLLVAVGAAWAYRRREPDGAGDAAASEPPDELLSNEERVLRVLEDHGGRVKQQAVAAELDWTDAKTSQVVGELREAGELESFRLGRENVLTLPDVAVEPEEDDS